MEYSLIGWQSWEVGWHLHAPWCSGVIPGYPCQTPAVWDFSSVIWSPVIVFSHFLLIRLFPRVRYGNLAFTPYVFCFSHVNTSLVYCHRSQRGDKNHRAPQSTQNYRVIQGKEAVHSRDLISGYSTLCKVETHVLGFQPKSYKQKLLSLVENQWERERERRWQVERAKEGQKGQKGGGKSWGRLRFTFLLPLLLFSEPYRNAFQSLYLWLCSWE